MKVLFLMFTFPEMSTSFNMYTSLVEEFIAHGHEVVIIAPGDKLQNTGIYFEKGIPVLRVKILPVKNVHNFIKGIANLLLPFQFGRALNKFFPDHHFDLVLTPTPPITLVDLVSQIKKRSSTKFYLILRDIFPQNAVDLGYMKKNGLLYNYFRKKECLLYSLADYIACMSQANINYILKNNDFIPINKLQILENFQISYTNSQPDKLGLRKRFGLENKYVAVFGGNMGKAQQLENVLQLAKSCEDYEDVIFLLLGTGLQKKHLEKEIGARKLNNIHLLDAIPKNDYQNLISVCNVGLISLHKNFTIPNIPSKTLDYFNVSLPVLASIDSATDYGDILTIANAGLWSLAGDLPAFKANFDILYHDTSLRKRLGQNGKKYFEKYLTPNIAYASVIKHISA